MKPTHKTSLIYIALMLSACAPQANISLHYVPISLTQIDIGLDVTDFTYIPKNNLENNEILNTSNNVGITHLPLDETVSSFVTNAVKREFHTSGSRIDTNENCFLSGDINSLEVKLGWDPSYRAVITYSLGDRSLGKQIYKSTFSSKIETEGMTGHNALNNISKVVAQNINELLMDQKFRDIILRNCSE